MITAGYPKPAKAPAPAPDRKNTGHQRLERHKVMPEQPHNGGLNDKNQKFGVAIGSSPDRIAPPAFKTRPDMHSHALRALRAKAAGCATRPAPKIPPHIRQESAMKQAILN